MKKTKAAIVTLVLALIMAMPTLAMANQVSANPQEAGLIPIRAFFEEMGAGVDWQDEDRSIHIAIDGGTVILFADRTAAYVNGNAVTLQDAIALWQGMSFITEDDLAMLFATFMPTPDVAAEDETAIVIIVGRYGQGTPEENEMVRSILGHENSQERFNIYFNWFNTVHEIGHAVEHYLQDEGFGFLDGEKFANAFAAGFWAHYGDEETFNMLREIISHAVENIDSPRPYVETLYDFARLWDAEEVPTATELFAFESYGWFQFNMVYRVLYEMRDFATVLREAGFEVNEVPPQRTLAFPSLGEDYVPEILIAAFDALRDDWGIELGNVYFMPADGPHMHALLKLTPEILLDIRMQLAQLGLTDLSVTEIVEIVLAANLPILGLGEPGEIIRIWSLNQP
jgi:hypothetical protein